jgi:CarD family transcriptional regulator
MAQQQLLNAKLVFIQEMGTWVSPSRGREARGESDGTRKNAAKKKALSMATAQKKPAPTPKKLKFKTNEFIVYPAHGVGKIVNVEEQTIAGAKLELYVVDFFKEKMRLRVPTAKCEAYGMRKLAEKPLVEQALKVLKGRARIKRTMWSRRAQEYEAKINSGDLIAVAEVVRDLFRSDRQPEQSYSERQLYEAALDRMAREIAAVKKISDEEAVAEIEQILDKTARKNEKAAEEAAAEKAA